MHTRTQADSDTHRGSERQSRAIDVCITCGRSRTRTFTHTHTNSKKLKKAPIFYSGQARAMWVCLPAIHTERWFYTWLSLYASCNASCIWWFFRFHFLLLLLFSPLTMPLLTVLQAFKGSQCTSVGSRSSQIPHNQRKRNWKGRKNKHRAHRTSYTKKRNGKKRTHTHTLT